MKTFLILSETHNGGLILQPWGRDRPNCNSDVSYGPRTLPTATGAILLALGKQKLRITGSGLESKSVATPKKQGFGRTARVLPEKYFPLLDKALLNALGELSLNGDLKALPMTITEIDAKVLLTKVESDTTLIFESTVTKKKTAILYRELTLADQALLSRLVARIRPTSKEAQAYAGVFMERTGDTKTADQYFQKSGTDLRQQIEGLFE